ENNDILFTDKNVIWKYVGEDTYEASRNLVHAGYGARSVEAAKKLNESSAATALGHAVQNRSLELTVEELQFLYSMDPHGAKEYVTGIPGYTQKEKEHKKELREELYKLLTGEEIQYYKHKWSNWEKTDSPEGDIWGTVKSNADFALEVNDGIPDDLLSVVKPITYTAAAFYGLNTLGVFLEGVSIYGFRMASGLAANGMLREMIADYNSTLGATDADEQFIINALNSTDKDEEFLGEAAQTNGRFSGELVKVNKPDAGADALAKRLNGQSRMKFSNDPKGKEFDAISDIFIGETKPALQTYNKSVRNQMKAAFEAAQQTDRKVYYHFEGQPAQSVIDKLYEYSNRYKIEVIIDTKPLF
ncbi:restriction endonuclease fold toxin, partial [Vallitalea maricola]|uniref:restriction endonuclease fold toxin n=1 Tax=Vallitalea maricola TaxID=3074433 RepID=UPI0030DA14D0